MQEFCEPAFARVGRDWNEHVVVDPQFLRPAEVDLLVGDAALAHDTLGWRPETTFTELVETMVDADLDLVEWQKVAGRPANRRLASAFRCCLLYTSPSPRDS